MNNNNWKQAWAVLLLAFLQCFAPLLHAHPGGASASHGVHVHWEMVLQADASRGAGVALSHVGDDEATIVVAQEFKHDYAIQPGEPLAAVTQPLLPIPLERRNDLPPTPSRLCAGLCYILHLAQAPPAA